MGITKPLTIPHYLKKFEHDIVQTISQSAHFQFTMDNDYSLHNHIWGVPSVNNFQSAPLDMDGEPMKLLIEIDFSTLNLSEPFPSKGVLQFFVNSKFGTDECLKSEEQCVLCFIEDPIPNTQRSEQAYFPQFCFPIQFRGLLINEPVSALDYRFKQMLAHCSHFVAEDEQTFEDIYTCAFLGAEHKVGGFPYFIHEDFRLKHPSLQKYDTLLLQLVSDDRIAFEYRDSGIVSFFIESEKLAKRDFSNVYMHTEHYE